MSAGPAAARCQIKLIPPAEALPHGTRYARKHVVAFLLKITAYLVVTAGSLVCGALVILNDSRLAEQGREIVAAATLDADLAGPAITRAQGEHFSRIVRYGLCFCLLIVAGAFLVAHDLANWIGERVAAPYRGDQRVGDHESYLENAELLLNSGHPLQAIELLREYLHAHPRDPGAALRIAAIYEQPLGNFLAAALEYEEILKMRMNRENWGWLAIHLANLYSGKLKRHDKTLEILKRIVAQGGGTQACEKARCRLQRYYAAQKAAQRPALVENETTFRPGARTYPLAVAQQLAPFVRLGCCAVSHL